MDVGSNMCPTTMAVVYSLALVLLQQVTSHSCRSITSLEGKDPNFSDAIIPIISSIQPSLYENLRHQFIDLPKRERDRLSHQFRQKGTPIAIILAQDASSINPELLKGIKLANGIQDSKIEIDAVSENGNEKLILLEDYKDTIKPIGSEKIPIKEISKPPEFENEEPQFTQETEYSESMDSTQVDDINDQIITQILSEIETHEDENNEENSSTEEHVNDLDNKLTSIIEVFNDKENSSANMSLDVINIENPDIEEQSNSDSTSIEIHEIVKHNDCATEKEQERILHAHKIYNLSFNFNKDK